MKSGHNWLNSSGVQQRMAFLRLCKTLHLTMQDGIDRCIRRMGLDLTTSQLDVIICIAEGCGGPVNQKDIEEELRLTNPTVTGILKRLERKGFVDRAVGSRDRRYKEVCLTEKSSQLGDRLHPSAQVMLGQLFRDFSLQEFDELNRLLRRLVENCRQAVWEEEPGEALAQAAQAVPACPSGTAR